MKYIVFYTDKNKYTGKKKFTSLKENLLEINSWIESGNYIKIININK